MVTLVGTQDDFAKALKSLIELEYDAIEAYETAIDRLESSDYQDKFSEFKGDHQRHIQELTELLESKGEDVPEGPSAKQWLTKGKIVLADLIGDATILAAMHSNEIDTNTAYERLCDHPGKWVEAENILDRGLADERRHKAWLKDATE